MVKALAIASVALVCVQAPAHAAGADEAMLFRVFLRNGLALTSYGEYARVGDRVVFSMPIAPAGAAPEGVPPLHLVNLPDSAVDWVATERYTESARYAQYVATRGDLDYAAMNNHIARALVAISNAREPARRLELALGARRALADWPGAQFGYRAAEIAQIGGMLDEVIGELRVETGGTAFDLSFVANVAAPVYAPLLSPATERELAEQALAVAHMADSPTERLSLLESIAAALEPSTAAPHEVGSWRMALRAVATDELAAERKVDAQYDVLSAELLRSAQQRARRADVAGVERVLDGVDRRDRWLGRRRPDRIRALVDGIRSELESAQRLRLARDRWELRLPALQKYRRITADLLDPFEVARPRLEDIRRLAGVSDVRLARISQTMDGVARALRAITPPDDLAIAHALLLSALDLAGTAARVRREAVQSGSLETARDASSAAAGALMLMTRAREEIEKVQKW